MPNALGRVRRWSKRAGTAGTTGKGTYYVVKGLTKGSFMDAMIVDTVVVAKRIDIKDFL